MVDTIPYPAGWQAVALGEGFNSAMEDLAENDDLYLMLLEGSYSPDTTTGGDRYKSDIDSHEVPDTATGYDEDGKVVPISAVGGVQPTFNGGVVAIDDSDVTITWPAADFSYQYAVLYDDGPPFGSRPLLAVMDFGAQNPTNEDINITFTDGNLWTFFYA